MNTILKQLSKKIIKHSQKLCIDWDFNSFGSYALKTFFFFFIDVFVYCNLESPTKVRQTNYENRLF